MKFCGEVGHGPGRNILDFGGNPVSYMDRGLFSRMLYCYQIKHKLTLCKSLQCISASYERILIKFFGGVIRGP